MGHFHQTHLGRIALFATGAMLLAGGAASAQTVRMFDDAPSIEQLRSIMIPESRIGIGRTIVIQHPDSGAPNTAVHRASAEVSPAPAEQVTIADKPVTPARISAPPTAAPSRQAEQAPAETVGFHINFAFDSAALPDSAHVMIDRVAQVLKEAPDVKVRVEGHTDAAGSSDYNTSLSERRALSVAEYLVKLGVEPSRLTLVGKGKTEPLTQNGYDPANRRVQFVRMG